MARRPAELVGPSTKGSTEHRRLRLDRETTRLLPLVLPVASLGTAAVVVAAAAYAASGPTLRTLAGAGALLAVTTLAEAFPVPLERVPVGGTSLATIFIVGASVIYGWETATLVAFLAMVVVETGRRRPLTRVAYNAGVYALAGAATSMSELVHPNDSFGWLFPRIALAAAAFYAADLILVAVAVSRSAREPFVALLRDALSSTLIAFSIMASLSLLLAVLWQRSPFLCAALAGPVVAIALYQRSVHRELTAMRLALTDPLTGLPNRRRFLADLKEGASRAAEDSPTVLVIFDLNGFKRYNDSYGHLAGDALLARLGASLADTVEPHGTAYRLGGDEFCVLTKIGAQGLEATVARATAALSERGPGFTVSASSGAVVIPHETPDHAIALQLADERLYAQKGTRQGASAGQQIGGVLLQALHESEPDLSRHMREVAALSHAVGRRMNLSNEELDELTRAAELHDVGKMAIPDAVWNQPGPLGEQDLELVRQHTIVAERILNVAPPMRGVAKIVRASHERYDGQGYPDRLAGEQIPLGARIISVCDAFEAMVAERCYRAPLTVTEALAELRRCAGTQFDPFVVVAFCEELQNRMSGVDETHTQTHTPNTSPQAADDASLPALERS